MPAGSRTKDETPQLNAYSKIGEHPRLYMTGVKLQVLKTRLHKYPYSKFWGYVQKRAEDYARETPPSSAHDYDDNSIRDLGNKLPFIAIAYLITHDGRYVKAARNWMDALTSYPNWASNNDLGAAHLLFGMSIVYDWMHDVFTEAELSAYRQKMISQADILYRAGTIENIWWANAYLQGHNYANSMAMAVAGVALYGECDNASAWLRHARQNFKEVIRLLSPDGASHEGLGYWGYGMDSMLKYYLAVDGVYGMDEPLQSGYFRNAARFRLYSSLPDLVEHADYADSPRQDWYGPGYILRALASLFRDGHAQWLAENIEKERGGKSTYSWLDLIWYDETIDVTPPDDLPTYAYFENLGIFVGRTDWSKNSAWFFFKAGPSQGKLAQAQGIYSGSHIHPDEGNFLIASRKGWLVIDDGYSLRKRTENHNVLLINNGGQLGEGKQWFDEVAVRKFRGTSGITYIDLQPEYQYLEAELAGMYAPVSGVRSWKRTIVVVSGSKMVVRDDVELARPGTVQSLIHVAKQLKQAAPNLLCEYFTPGFVMEAPVPGDISLATRNFSIASNERRGPASLAANYLVSKEMESVSKGTLVYIFTPNARGCEGGGVYRQLASGNNVLEMDLGGRYVTVDFIGRKVMFNSSSGNKDSQERGDSEGL